VKKSSLATAAARHGCDQYLVRIINSYLTDREIVIRHGRDVHRKVINRGIPQGGILSPTLFALSTLSLIDRIEECGYQARTLLYADDVAIAFAADDLDNLQINAEVILRTSESWFLEQGMELSVNKCSVLLMGSRGRQIVVRSTDGTTLPQVRNARYLGMTINDSLTWYPHLKKVCTDVVRAMMILRKRLHNYWSTKLARTALEMALLPRLSYGLVHFAPTLRTNRSKKLLSQTLGQLAKIILRAPKTASASVCAFLLGLDSFDVLLMERAARIRERMDLRQDRSRLPSIPPWVDIECVIPVSDEVSTEVSNTTLPSASTIVLFTDGSKKVNESGITEVKAAVATVTEGGALIPVTGATLHESESVYESEMEAIRLGLTWVLTRHGATDVHIFSDSRSCLEAIKSRKSVESSSRLDGVLQLAQKIHASGASLNLHWVRGHSDSRGNSFVDDMARNGVFEPSAWPRSLNSLLHKAKTRRSTTETDRIRKACWRDELTRIGSTPRSILGCWSRRLDWTSFPPCVISFVTGHYPCEYRRHKAGLSESSTCRCGRAVGTLEHLLTECNLLDEQRLEMWRIADMHGWNRLKMSTFGVNESMVKAAIPLIKAIPEVGVRLLEVGGDGLS
jgi:ribonuclease HI